MLQLMYISTARNVATASDSYRILTASRRNNSRDGITGFLYFDGHRFLQALEGEPQPVQATLERIRQDQRHLGIVVLSRRTIASREFGDWAMMSRGAPDENDPLLQRIDFLLANASPAVKSTFSSFAQIRMTNLQPSAAA